MTKSKLISLDRLVEAGWNPNRVKPALMARIRRSLQRFGVVEGLVARPHPQREGAFEILSGNHRLRLLRELGHEKAPVVVVDLDDAQARLLAQTLNRTRGSDDPAAYARLLDEVLKEFSAHEVSEFLPESEASIEAVLRELAGETAAPEPRHARPERPRSKPGELYELGPHRLLCGDATSRADVERLFAGERALLLSSDPPYGIQLDHGWRDGLRQRSGSARSGGIANDDRADWSEAFALAANVAQTSVVYAWHSALHCVESFAALEAAGFEVRQQIVWVKDVHVLGRAHYHWQHENCWYAVRRGCSASWNGGRKQTTVWNVASPIIAFGAADDDVATAHPTQKPLELFSRPILNHTEPNEIVYDPFCGSGTCLIAAEQHNRRCFAIEIDPGWCDVIRDRYASFTSRAQGAC
jgi:DNA modification methylase